MAYLSADKPRNWRSGTTRRRFLGRSRRGGLRASCDSGSGIGKRTGLRGSALAGSGKGVLPMGGGVRRLSWRFIASSPLTSRPARARRTATKPVLESLEGRQLLALFTGFSHVRNILTNSGVYSFQIDGPGVLKTQPAGGGSFDVKVLGTTDASTLTITQVRPRFHVANNLMSIDNLTIRSGQIGSILAGPVELDGAMSPLSSSVGTLEFGALGPGAQINVNGSVGSMSVGQLLLGPAGHVIIAGNLNGTTVPTNNSTTSASGTGSVTITGTVTGTINATGTGSGTAPTTPQTVGAITIGTMAINGGEFVVVGDAVAPIQITNDMSLSDNGLFSIGRDLSSTLSVG